MTVSRKFIAISSIIVGIISFLVGIVSIGIYIYSVVDVLDKADQSVIFWYLGFALMGIQLVALGIYFIWIGYKSRKKEKYVRLAKYSLGVISAVLLVLIIAGAFSEWSADKTRSERIKTGTSTEIPSR